LLKNREGRDIDDQNAKDDRESAVEGDRATR
jgi:hypothetical protein